MNERSLTLVIPAFNEEAVIEQAISEAAASLSRLGLDYEILVVDDGSTDQTAAIVRAAAVHCPRLRLVQHQRNLGYGAALRTGFEKASCQLIGFTDADCQFHLQDLERLLPLTADHGIVVGHRLHRQDPWKRRFYSWGYNVLVRSMLGTRVKDCDCALKVFRRSTLGNLLPQSRGFFVNAEMLAQARRQGVRIAEIGVRHRPRPAGASKVSVLDIPPVLMALLPFWWSKILFAARPAPIADRRTAWRIDWALIGLMSVAAVLFFSRLRSPLLEPEESRYAEIPRQMLAEGRWLVPVLHEESYLQKPPLLYWLVMSSYRAFGVHDWAARLVPCLAGLAIVFVAYGWGQRTMGKRSAFLGAIMLCLSGRFIYMSRMVTMDGLLALWVLVGWACGHLALQEGHRRWLPWLGAGLACGLAVLTKGPVGLILIALPLGMYQILDPRSGRISPAGWTAFFITVFAIAAPWYAAVAAREPGFLGDFLYRHNLLRYVTPFDHEEPFWYYIPLVFAGMMPWSLLLAPLLRCLLARPARGARKRPAALGFFLLAFGTSFAFYSLAGCKRPGYILPAMPPLALALGCYLSQRLPRLGLGSARLAVRRFSLLPHRATILMLAGGVVFFALSMSAGVARPQRAIPMAIVCAGIVLFLLRRGPMRNPGRAWAVCGAVTFLLLMGGLHEVLPGYAHKFSLRAQVRPQRSLTMDPDVRIACYPHRWDSVSFYLGRDDVRTYAADERAQLIADLSKPAQTMVFVKSDRYYRELVQALPGWLEFQPCGKNGLVTAGLVCRRPVVADSLFARR